MMRRVPRICIVQYVIMFVAGMSESHARLRVSCSHNLCNCANCSGSLACVSRSLNQSAARVSHSLTCVLITIVVSNDKMFKHSQTQSTTLCIFAGKTNKLMWYYVWGGCGLLASCISISSDHINCLNVIYTNTNTHTHSRSLGQNADKILGSATIIST